ncbi:MAG: LysM peptidoglycan-binding domain-containing protein [Buchananella hordeovulneris]|nr:LysM peptidoglycan-binding domain-containing protein [Buchananella hordeovulneris]
MRRALVSLLGALGVGAALPVAAAACLAGLRTGWAQVHTSSPETALEGAVLLGISGVGLLSAAWAGLTLLLSAATWLVPGSVRLTRLLAVAGFPLLKRLGRKASMTAVAGGVGLSMVLTPSGAGLAFASPGQGAPSAATRTLPAPAPTPPSLGWAAGDDASPAALNSASASSPSRATSGADVASRAEPGPGAPQPSRLPAAPVLSWPAGVDRPSAAAPSPAAAPPARPSSGAPASAAPTAPRPGPARPTPPGVVDVAPAVELPAQPELAPRASRTPGELGAPAGTAPTGSPSAGSATGSAPGLPYGAGNSTVSASDAARDAVAPSLRAPILGSPVGHAPSQGSPEVGGPSVDFPLGWATPAAGSAAAPAPRSPSRSLYAQERAAHSLPVWQQPATHRVAPGDSLWAIAAQLQPDASPAEIDAAWRAIYQQNRSVIGEDPNLILPGQSLEIPGEVQQ